MTMQHVLEEIFKAYDVRGKVGTELTPEVVRQIGRAFADWLPKEGMIAVGRDMRPDSAELAAALIEGIVAQGRNVLDIGQITTDMIYFATGSKGLAGGAVVTASHNPGQYNGIKFCRDEAQAVGLESGLQDIKQRVIDQSFAEALNSGTVTYDEIAEDWIGHVLSFIQTDRLLPLRIAVDAGNGMAGKIFPEIEPYVPWDVTEMYFELDGTFPNHDANPTKFENLQDIIKVIQKNKLDGGIAFDGDGDRAYLIDETGTVLTGGVMCALLSDYFLIKYPKSNIIYDIRNSRSVKEVIEEAGGTAVLERVGHSYIKQKMRQVDAPFGGEASGHFYFRDNWYADSGLIGAVIGLYASSIRKMKLSEIRKLYTRYAAIPETNFTVTNKTDVMEAVANAFPKADINRLDGITLDFGDGSWLNIRPSNTEPLLRLNAEAKTQSQLDALIAKVTNIISATAKL